MPERGSHLQFHKPLRLSYIYNIMKYFHTSVTQRAAVWMGCKYSQVLQKICKDNISERNRQNCNRVNCMISRCCCQMGRMCVIWIKCWPYDLTGPGRSCSTNTGRLFSQLFRFLGTVCVPWLCKIQPFRDQSWCEIHFHPTTIIPLSSTEVYCFTVENSTHSEDSALNRKQYMCVVREVGHVQTCIVFTSAALFAEVPRNFRVFTAARAEWPLLKFEVCRAP